MDEEQLLELILQIVNKQNEMKDEIQFNRLFIYIFIFWFLFLR